MQTIKDITYSHLGNFRFRKIKSGYIITNDSGDWVYLRAEDFFRFLHNTIAKTEPVYAELLEKQFLYPDQAKLAAQASKYLKLHRSVYDKGTTLFIVVLTLRCNHHCLYCQTTPEKPDAQGFDMDEATAKKTVDLIFQSPSANISIEFQGGEPVFNWPVLQYIVQYAGELAKLKRKNLRVNLVSNLTLLDDEKIQFLLDNNVSVSCSLDGPAEVHDKNRPYLGKGSSHAQVVKRIKALNRAIKAKRKGAPGQFVDELNAITTVSKFSLPFSKDIVDEYVKLGFSNIFLRPLSPFGLDKKTYDLINCKAEDFIPFYRKALDYILELNLQGTLIVERNTYMALCKIIKNEDPAYYELRDPCGAGIGQMAFNFDGSIYTCDEGRMAARMGFENFKLGDVKKSQFDQLIDHEVTKTMCMASCLDNHAGCTDCAYKPYCGVCPLLHYIEYGTIFPQIPATDQCKIKMAMFDDLFLKLKTKKFKTVFEGWLKRASSPL